MNPTEFSFFCIPHVFVLMRLSFFLAACSAWPKSAQWGRPIVLTVSGLDGSWARYFSGGQCHGINYDHATGTFRCSAIHIAERHVRVTFQTQPALRRRFAPSPDHGSVTATANVRHSPCHHYSSQRHIGGHVAGLVAIARNLADQRSDSLTVTANGPSSSRRFRDGYLTTFPVITIRNRPTPTRSARDEWTGSCQRNVTNVAVTA